MNSHLKTEVTFSTNCLMFRVLRDTKCNLAVPKMRTGYGQKSFAFRGAKAWNKLYSEMILAPSTQSFPRGGTCENFDRDARVIFLGLKFTKMSFFWVSLSWRHFFGVEKIAVIFLGSLKICVIFLGY